MARIKKKCKICGRSFLTDKYHPYQKVCGLSACQHERQIKTMRQWRKRNQGYFKRTGYELEVERERSKRWREKHPDYHKMYFRERNNKEGNRKLRELALSE